MLVHRAYEQVISSEANPEVLRRQMADDRYSAIKSDPAWHKLLRSLAVITEYETDRKKTEKPSVYASKEWFCDFLVEHFNLSGENRPHPVYGVYVLLGANLLDGAIEFIEKNMESNDNDKFDWKVYAVSAIVGNAIANPDTPIEEYETKIEALGRIPGYSIAQALCDIRNGRARETTERMNNRQKINDTPNSSEDLAQQNNNSIDELIQVFSNPKRMAQALENHFGKNS